MKKCSTSFSIKVMKIKVTLRFYLTPVRMAIIKKTTKNAGEDGMGKVEGTPYIVGGNVN
jgi:hypothetical protein